MTDSPQPLSERDQTDESLRLERRRADDPLEHRVAVEELADEVINRARKRADALLASARAMADQTAKGTPASETLRSSRAEEDRILQRERVTADHILHDERSEHHAVLSHEREETDKDLSDERARSDHALAKRDDFLVIVSHDLLNTLEAIVGVSERIETDVSQENHVEQVVRHARRIQRSGARMRRLVGDLMDVASIEVGMLAVTRVVGDPAEAVTEAVETFQAQALESGVSVVAEIVPPLPPTAFDPARILQVLGNLLSNAIKFTAAQGTVVVRVERVAEEIMFAISDTGQGIPADKLDVVFERFVQLSKHDRRGVGLGLYVSKCIIKGHGGRMWAGNRAGGGSTFSFTLPTREP
jgi:signal transduction histidine kinase